MRKILMFLCLMLFMACSPAVRKPEAPAYLQARKIERVNLSVLLRQKYVAQRLELLCRRSGEMDTTLTIVDRVERRLDSLRVAKTNNGGKKR